MHVLGIDLKQIADSATIAAELILVHVPAVSQDGQSYYGKWHCASPYLGNNLVGTFTIAYPSCKQPGSEKPRTVRIGPTLARRTPGATDGGRCFLEARFFDNNSNTTPFLAIYNFALSPPGVFGVGEVRRHYVPGTYPLLSWRLIS